MNVVITGTAQQKQAAHTTAVAAIKGHIDAMATGFEFLQRYGLTRKGILSAMLPACVFTVVNEASEYMYDRPVTRLLKAGHQRTRAARPPH